MFPVSDFAAETFLGWSSVVLPPRAAAAASFGLAGVPRPPSHSPLLQRAQGALGTSLQPPLLERARKVQLTAQRFPACSGLILPVPWRVGAGRPRVSLSSSWALSLPIWAVRLSLKQSFPGKSAYRMTCRCLSGRFRLSRSGVWVTGIYLGGLFCLLNFSF